MPAFGSRITRITFLESVEMFLASWLFNSERVSEYIGKFTQHPLTKQIPHANAITAHQLRLSMLCTCLAKRNVISTMRKPQLMEGITGVS